MDISFVQVDLVADEYFVVALHRILGGHALLSGASQERCLTMTSVSWRLSVWFALPRDASSDAVVTALPIIFCRAVTGQSLLSDTS
jgi:hypothetical protein